MGALVGIAGGSLCLGAVYYYYISGGGGGTLDLVGIAGGSL